MLCVALSGCAPFVNPAAVTSGTLQYVRGGGLFDHQLGSITLEFSSDNYDLRLRSAGNDEVTVSGEPEGLEDALDTLLRAGLPQHDPDDLDCMDCASGFAELNIGNRTVTLYVENNRYDPIIEAMNHITQQDVMAVGNAQFPTTSR